MGDPGQVLRSFRLRFELIQFSSKTRSFPSVGVTAIPTVKETIPPAQAVKWIFVFPIRRVVADSETILAPCGSYVDVGGHFAV